MFKHKHRWRKTGKCFVEDGTLYYEVKCKKCRECKHITLSEYISAVDEWSKGSRAWKAIEGFGKVAYVYDPEPNPKCVEDYIE